MSPHALALNSPIKPPCLTKITGTFIQYQSWIMELSPSQWIAELNAMSTAGLDTIVIQWTKVNTNRFYPIHSSGIDPTEQILTYADQHKIKVFLGLQFDREWWDKWDDSEFLSKAISNTKSLGQLLLQRYGKHTSLIGWYIPFEMDDTDYDNEEIKKFSNFWKSITRTVKNLSKKKYLVSMSTFFSGKLPAPALLNNYARIFNQSEIDIVMIQDGVGARGWDEKMREKVTPFANALSTAAKKNHIQPWGVVESFSHVQGDSRIPADISRLTQQVKLQRECHVEKIITFDFFHYMSPLRGDAQKLLNKKYREQFLPNN